MLVVDASAILSVLLGEQDGDYLAAQILLAKRCMMSPLNWWEVQTAMHSRYGPSGVAIATDWMKSMKIHVEPATSEHAQIALSAFVAYRGRPAKLNLGDCFAYALSKALDAPLLYKGNDFGHTDVRGVGVSG